MAQPSTNGLGDMDPAAFRREGHRTIDWIADYFENIENYRRPLPREARRDPIGAPLRRARTGGALPADLRGLRAHHRPRDHALEPPGLLRLFRHHRQRAGRARGAVVRGAQRPGDAVEDVAIGDRVGGGCARLAPPADRPAAGVRRRHLRHRLDVEPARPGGGARGDRAGRALAGPARARGASQVPRLLFGARALVDRQGRHPDRPRPHGAEEDRGRRSVQDAAGRAGPRHCRRSRGSRHAARDRCHRRHDVDDERRSRAGHCRHRRGGRGVAPRRRGLRRRHRDDPGTPARSRWLRSRRLARRQPAQVAVHAVRPERVLLPAHGRAPRRRFR